MSTNQTQAQPLEDLYNALHDAIEKLMTIDYVGHEYAERCWQFKLPANKSEVLDCIRHDYYNRILDVAAALETMDTEPKKTA